MKLIILAAGEGVRMRPLTLTVPKPLLIYRGKTALDHIFSKLPNEITEVIISVNYLGEKIKSHCGNEFYGRKISYVQGDSKGNALGFLAMKNFFINKERFMVMYADDVLTQKEIDDCLAHEYSWLCYPVKNIHEVGIVTKGDTGFVESFVEKPTKSDSNLAANGCMVVNADIFDFTPVMHAKGEYYFSDLMAQFTKRYAVYAVIGDEHHMQLTSPKDIDFLNSTNEY